MQPGARGLLRKWPGGPQVIPERKKSPEAVDPSCARSERANTGYGHQKGMAVGRPHSEMAPSR